MISLRRTLASQLSRTGRAGVRPFSATALAREAQIFDMPSMSPTMEEGGIIEWNFKPGDAFSAGDVLLEIETDKAQIAVEAADDGVLAKILVEAGAKGIPVGQAIAVTAEPEDDIAALDIDALLKGRASAPAQAKPAEAESDAAQPEPAQSAPPVQAESAPAAQLAKPAPSESHGNHGRGPLPAAVRLLHENGLSIDAVSGTGPFGRITKGDVLALLGKIPREYPAKEQQRFDELEKMDLSNVVPAPAPSSGSSSSADAPTAKAPEKPQPLVTKLSIPLVSAAHAVKVAGAQRAALRAALLAIRPKPSALRDPTLDLLTAPTRPPFVVKKSQVVVLRARPVSLEVELEEPPKAKPGKAVEVYVAALEAELALEASN